VTLLIQQTVPRALLPAGRPWAVWAAGLILVTYAWQISELVLSRATPPRQAMIIRRYWPRMMWRAALMTASALLLQSVLAAATPASAASAHGMPLAPLLGLGIVGSIGQIWRCYRRESLAIDIAVSLASALVVTIGLQFLSLPPA
jgi:hypothetical protein